MAVATSCYSFDILLSWWIPRATVHHRK